MKRFSILLLILFVPLFMAAKATPPQSLVDAIALCERDREAITTAQVTLDAAAKAKAKAVLDSQNDYKALLALIESIYGPTPTPDPVPPNPAPPEPPQPPAPPPIPTQPTLMLITGTGDWCAACSQFAKEVAPSVNTLMGSLFTTVDYSSTEAKKAYPESALVPRFVLTRPDGKVEKRIGYQTFEQIQAWLGIGGAK